jgi:peptidoglycan hydrolase-like protein with peptidoglycan-binding domain
MRAQEFISEIFKNPFASSAGDFKIEVPDGNRGLEVADAQKALEALGFPLPNFGVDGIKGPETTRAIKDFQSKFGVPANGSLDKTTVDELNKAVKEKGLKLKKSTSSDVKISNAAKIDVSTIQDPDFDKKLQKIADDLGVKKSDLIAIMKQESRVNPQAVNPMSGATGLIQFMPSTAERLGTSTSALKQMTAVEQLDYVYKYFKMVGVKPGMDLGDLYMAVFMPAHIGKSENFVLGAAGAPGFSGKVYAQNRGLDKDRNGVITISDVKAAVQRYA